MNADEAIAFVRPYTKSSRERLLAMVHALQTIDKNEVAGDVVECGVWRGGNIILTRLISPHRICWLYDTFEGMVNPSKYDVTHKGQIIYIGKAAVSLPDVIANLAETGTLDLDQLRFVRGPVESTLLEQIPQKIALLRLDTDWYESTKIELNVLWSRLEKNGIMIVDDYGHWLGARKAVDEFFGKNPPKMVPIDYTAIMVVKT
jgi:O-methyltransferase